MRTKLLFVLFSVSCLLLINCSQNSKKYKEQEAENLSSMSKDTTTLTEVEDETKNELKEVYSQLNIRDFFHPKNKKTEMVVISEESKFRDVYSIVNEDDNYITVNKTFLYQYGEQWTIANDSYITYFIKNKEITQIKSTGKSSLDGTYTDSHSEVILKLPINNDSINWEYATDKEKYDYSARLKYFKAKKVRGGFIQIPAIELTKDGYIFNTDSGNWKRVLTNKEYWGKGCGLLLIILPYDNNSVSEFNSEIKSSTYQILDFVDGYKGEKLTKEEFSNTISDREQGNSNININNSKEINNKASQQLLTEEDLLGLSKQELRLARNEIFARHGYIFKSKDLHDYFEKQSWYSPQYNDVSNKLSSIEKQNIEFIKKYE